MVVAINWQLKILIRPFELNPKFAEAYSNREVAYARLGMRIRR